MRAQGVAEKRGEPRPIRPGNNRVTYHQLCGFKPRATSSVMKFHAASFHRVSTSYWRSFAPLRRARRMAGALRFPAALILLLLSLVCAGKSVFGGGGWGLSFERRVEYQR